MRFLGGFWAKMVRAREELRKNSFVWVEFWAKMVTAREEISKNVFLCNIYISSVMCFMIHFMMFVIHL